ncbi:MAG: hypothetical protein WHS89_06045, partial [Acidimicrobiales bacterium]
IVRADVPVGTVTNGWVYCRVIAQDGEFVAMNQGAAALGLVMLIFLRMETHLAYVIAALLLLGFGFDQATSDALADSVVDTLIAGLQR